MGKKDKKQKEDPKMTTTTSEKLHSEQEAQTTIAKEKGDQKLADEDKIITLHQEINELKDKYLRLHAEFDNYRKRSLKEKLDDRKLAKKDIMTELLPILDDFDRAGKIASENNTVESMSEGMRLIQQKLINTLTQQGLEAVEPTHDTFDPEIHEAIAEIPAPSETLKGKVVDTVEKGYKLNGIIIRHPKVVVGK